MQSGNYGGYSNLGNQALGGMAGILGGLFGNSGAPYQNAMNQYQQYGQMGAGTQNPFLQAGQGSIGNYDSWLQQMKDPSGFLNNLMNNYQESPWAKFSQQQGMRTAQNMGSASGLTGSTPLMMQAQQNAQNISGQDMNNWLQNALGINNQYGSGLNNLMGYGANSANSLTNMYSALGNNMGQASYNQQAAQNNQNLGGLGGILQLGASAFGL